MPKGSLWQKTAIVPYPPTLVSVDCFAGPWPHYHWAMSHDANTPQLPPCPQCHSEFTYEDGALLICPECAHEWNPAAAPADTEDVKVWKDAFGSVLADGDTVTLIKDLKLKGSSSVIKVGTKVKNIRLVAGDHDIDCKIEGFGAMQLKSEFVRKA